MKYTFSKNKKRQSSEDELNRKAIPNYEYHKKIDIEASFLEEIKSLSNEESTKKATELINSKFYIDYTMN